jgi:GTP pyrophosphokinase
MELSKRFVDALNFAVTLHAQQQRKVSGAPYAAHLLGVASIAMEYGASETEAVAALLHDAIEDQGGAAMREQLQRRFGDEVTAIVEGCTDAVAQPKPPWRQRKEAYVAHLRHASPSVCLVSAADKLHNARALLQEYRARGEAVWGHFRGGRVGMLWYYEALVAALKQAGSTPLVEELERTVTELEREVAKNVA